MKVYLAGAIEKAPDLGRGWRGEITPFFINVLGHEVVDPSRNELKVLTEEESLNFRSWKTTDIKRFRETVRKFIALDLDTIQNEIDYVVCLWDKYVLEGGGTQAEVAVSYRSGIPVYIVTDLPIEKVSAWGIGCSEEIFDDFEDLKKFLRKKFIASP